MEKLASRETRRDKGGEAPPADGPRGAPACCSDLHHLRGDRVSRADLGRNRSSCGGRTRSCARRGSDGFTWRAASRQLSTPSLLSTTITSPEQAARRSPSRKRDRLRRHHDKEGQDRRRQPLSIPSVSRALVDFAAAVRAGGALEPSRPEPPRGRRVRIEFFSHLSRAIRSVGHRPGGDPPSRARPGDPRRSRIDHRRHPRRDSLPRRRRLAAPGSRPMDRLVAATRADPRVTTPSDFISRAATRSGRWRGISTECPRRFSVSRRKAPGERGEPGALNRVSSGRSSLDARARSPGAWDSRRGSPGHPDHLQSGNAVLPIRRSSR
jgi:hypothetical protein